MLSTAPISTSTCLPSSLPRRTTLLLLQPPSLWPSPARKSLLGDPLLISGEEVATGASSSLLSFHKVATDSYSKTSASRTRQVRRSTRRWRCASAPTRPPSTAARSLNTFPSERMKQKVVIRVQMEDAKRRSKALKVAVRLPVNNPKKSGPTLNETFLGLLYPAENYKVYALLYPAQQIIVGLCLKKKKSSLEDIDIPRFLWTHLMRILDAILRRFQGFGSEAHNCYVQALRIQPTFAIAWSNLAGLFMEAGDLTKAILYYKLEGMAEASINVVPVTEEDDRIHKYQIPSDDCFSHLEVQFRFHGLVNTRAPIRLPRVFWKNMVLKGFLIPLSQRQPYRWEMSCGD